MATERVIDLASQRYADRPYEGELPPSAAAAERRRAQVVRAAAARVRARAEAGDRLAADVLVLLGLDK
jgi:hypothetical protein